jgi:carbonic anhydrase
MQRPPMVIVKLPKSLLAGFSRLRGGRPSGLRGGRPLSDYRPHTSIRPSMSEITFCRPPGIREFPTKCASLHRSAAPQPALAAPLFLFDVKASPLDKTTTIMKQKYPNATLALRFTDVDLVTTLSTSRLSGKFVTQLFLMCDQYETSFGAGGIRLPRRHFLKVLGAALSVPVGLRAAEKASPPKPQNVLSPNLALDRLMKGNLRYVSGNIQRHSFIPERLALALGQNPFAGILSCADSRIGPEYAFDTGRGDIFVCRVAGNFANTDTIASFEYAVSVLKTPLIFVLGHQSCGAVDATINQVKNGTSFPGHIPSLTEALTPAVTAASDQSGDLLANAIKQNVVLAIQKLQTAEPILSEAVSQKTLRVVGGVYNLNTGRIDMVSS